MAKNKLVKEVIAHFGTQVELARQLGIHAQSIGNWLHGRSPVPLKHALKIARLTNDKFAVEQLINKKTRRYLK